MAQRVTIIKTSLHPAPIKNLLWRCLRNHEGGSTLWKSFDTFGGLLSFRLGIFLDSLVYIWFVTYVTLYICLAVPFHGSMFLASDNPTS